MNIVLNEKTYAEDCIKNRTLGSKPFYTLTVLAKYYYSHFEYKKKKIIELLTDFLEKNYADYQLSKASWDESIERIAKNAGKHRLFEIDGVWITRAELDTIDEIHNKTLERLAFTLLCIAKLNNAKNPKNNGWINMSAKDVFTLARISCSASDRYVKLCQLNRMSLLEFPKRNDNLNNRVTFVNDDSEKVLFVDDFRELGYVYRKYKGENYTKCHECGIIFKNNKYGNKKYCPNCIAYIPKQYKSVLCIDCGKEFDINPKNNQTSRCDDCYAAYRRKYYKENKRKQRTKSDLSTEQI